jgi:hypothetical protein
MADEVKCAFAVQYPEAVKIITEQLDSVVGEVLTIIEASMPEGSSREATKVLVKKAVWRGCDRMKLQMELQKR